jgi:ribosomal protein S12 methylthiotransferase
VRYFLDPFGCVKNQVDAENMMAFLNNAGWSASADAEDSDLIIVNSCGFIESAKRESINAVLNWRKLYPEKKILLAGCLAQRYAKELAESLPEADALFGIDDISKIVKKVNFFGGTRDRLRRYRRGSGEKKGLGTGDWGLGIVIRNIGIQPGSNTLVRITAPDPRSLIPIPDPCSPCPVPLM